MSRAWRAALGKDDALFDAALRRNSPALAATARKARLSSRAVALAAHAALKVPRSCAPAWAHAAAAKLEEWTLVADLFDVSSSRDAALARHDRRRAVFDGKEKNIFSVAFPVAALADLDEDESDEEGSDTFSGDWCASVARGADAPASDVPTLAAVRQQYGLVGRSMTNMSANHDGRLCLRLLALHTGGGVAVLCSKKQDYSVTTFCSAERGTPAWFRGSGSAGTSSTMCFEPAFGTGPRLRAHLTLCPKPEGAVKPAVCVLGFSSDAMEKAPRYDGPDTDTEYPNDDDALDDDPTHQDVLDALIAGPLRWST